MCGIGAQQMHLAMENLHLLSARSVSLHRMFRSLTRIPLRRCLHTIPPRPPPSQGNNFPLVFGIGAMVAAVTYMSGSSNQRIALDAPQLSGKYI